mgnify:CR=1 FL=1
MRKYLRKYYYLDENGNKFYRRTFTTPDGIRKDVRANDYAHWGQKKDAIILEEVKLADYGISAQELKEIENITLDQLADEWIYKVTPQQFKLRTVEDRESKYRIYISPKLGNFKVIDIKTPTIQKFFDELDINQKIRVKNTLNPLMKYAVEKRIINTNPIAEGLLTSVARGMKLKRAENRENIIHESFDREVMDGTVLQAINHKDSKVRYDSIPLMFMRYQGNRKGEAVAYRWSDINFKNNTVKVVNQVQGISKRISGKDTYANLYSPKTEHSVRVIPMSKIVRDTLENWEFDTPESSNELIYKTRNNTAMTGNNYSEKHLKPLLKRINAPKVSSQDFRKFYGSVEIANGVAPMTVAKRMGNSITTFERHYHREIEENSNS